jgi:hypothetical protein
LRPLDLRGARPKGYAQPLLHQMVTSLSSGNSVFSMLQKQKYPHWPVCLSA